MPKRGEGRGELNGFLDAGTSLQGELAFDDTFRIEGKLSGRIVSAGDLVVGERGEVDAVIEVGRLFVAGTLRGKATAQRIELAPGSRVYAELVTPALVVAEGAFLQAQCVMVEPAVPPGASVAPLPVAGR